MISNQRAQSGSLFAGVPDFAGMRPVDATGKTGRQVGRLLTNFAKVFEVSIPRPLQDLKDRSPILTHYNPYIILI